MASSSSGLSPSFNAMSVCNCESSVEYRDFLQCLTDLGATNDITVASVLEVMKDATMLKGVMSGKRQDSWMYFCL